MIKLTGKTTLLLIAIVLIVSSCTKNEGAENKEPNNEVVITGKINNAKSSKLSITYTNNMISNSDTLLVKDSLDDTGVFRLQFELDKPRFATLNISSEYTDIFMKPGDSIYVEMDGDSLDETITYSGDRAAENNYLAGKILNSTGVMQLIAAYYGMDEEPFLEAMDSMYLNKLSKVDEKLFDEYFVKVEKDNLKYEHASNLLNYEYQGYHDYALKSQNLVEDEGENSGDKIFEVVKKFDLNDETLLDNTAYTNFLDSYLSAVLWEDTSDASYEIKNKLTTVDNIFTNSNVNAFVKASELNSEVDYQGLSKDVMDLIDAYKKANPNQLAYIQELDKTVEMWKPLMEGNKAPVFTYKDLEGNEVSLTDFKGKYVYIDVWATWCGPCRAEAPYFQELTEKFKDEDVVFLGVSIDADKEAWEKYLEEKEPSSVQIYSEGAWKSQIAKDYNVNSIPRFLLIGPEGNIVSANAKRPSGGIEQQLNELLGLAPEEAETPDA